MTRSENMLRIKELQKKKTRDSILKLLNSLFQDEYKTKNGDWNKSKIARDLNIYDLSKSYPLFKIAVGSLSAYLYIYYLFNYYRPAPANLFKFD